MNELLNININEVMKTLSEKRPIFHSEADFQFELAWTIKKKYGDKVSIRLEYTPLLIDMSEDDKKLWKNARIDIVLFFNDSKSIVPIELKYLKHTLEYVADNGEVYNLSLGARGMGMYNCFADIERMELLKEKLKGFSKGYVIWLTNDKAYWEGLKMENNYSVFNAPDGTTIEEGQRHFREGAKVKGYPKYQYPISIKGNYKVSWQEYSELSANEKGKNNEFKYCVIDITSV
ncbi:MAG: hypothetical protein FWH32_02420 [Clostridiales bacterium]|nr:hypothetical protein [Clostridiales bacterium]